MLGVFWATKSNLGQLGPSKLSLGKVANGLGPRWNQIGKGLGSIF